MIILDEFIDLIKVIRIKIIAFYAEMSLDRFGKELRLISVGCSRGAELDSRADRSA